MNFQSISSFTTNTLGVVYDASSKLAKQAANVVRPIASTGLDCISGTAYVAKITTAAVGVSVTAVFTFDSYQNQFQTNHVWNRLNTCDRFLPTAFNMFIPSTLNKAVDQTCSTTISPGVFSPNCRYHNVKTCEESEIDANTVTSLFQKQMLWLPFVPVITLLACTALGKIEKGTASLSAKISG